MPKEKEPLMKQGMWTATLLYVDSDLDRLDKYFVGIFESAQDAYGNGNDYFDTLDTEGRPKPDTLVIELQGFGVYPDNIEEQFAFHYIEGAMGRSFMDCHGVTRASYMMRRACNE